MAKASAFPPDGFTIESARRIADQKAAEQAEADAANPIFAFWRDVVREPLLEGRRLLLRRHEGRAPAGRARQAEGL